MVGAPGFEPGTFCAQARRVIFLKSFLCNVVFESKRLTKKFGRGKQYENVAPHARGPPNFPHTWQDSRATPGVLAQLFKRVCGPKITSELPVRTTYKNGLLAHVDRLCLAKISSA
jgi:hypothetical protein